MIGWSLLVLLVSTLGRTILIQDATRRTVPGSPLVLNTSKRLKQRGSVPTWRCTVSTHCAGRARWG